MFIWLASTITLTIMVIAIMPSSSSVVAAFLLLGFWKAGTPFEIASTPVSAAHPDEKARASSRISPTVVKGWSQPSCGMIVRSALSAIGRVPRHNRNMPSAHIPRIATMNA